MDEWKEKLRFEPDPYSFGKERWVGCLPAGINWLSLEDRLVARGWYPKNAVARLRVYGTGEGHEVVIEPSTRQVTFRITCARGTSENVCESTAGNLAKMLLEEAR